MATDALSAALRRATDASIDGDDGGPPPSDESTDAPDKDLELAVGEFRNAKSDADALRAFRALFRMMS